MRHALVRSVAVLACLAAACADGGDEVLRVGQLELSASALDFGTVVVSQSATRSVTLANTGNAVLAGTATIEGPDYDFVQGGGDFVVEPGDLLTLAIRFAPSAEGAFPGSLDPGTGSTPVLLSGAGVLQAQGALCLLLPPDPIDFGFVATGETSFAAVEVLSVGTAPVVVNVTTSDAEFPLLAGGGVAVIEPGRSRGIALAFAPRVGGPVAGTVTIGPGCSTVSVRGAGTTVSFAADVRPILECAGCHAYADPGGYGTMVNVSSSTSPSALIVEPFDLSGSVLYGRITNSGQYGERMPPPGRPPLTPAEREIIRRWIVEGAPDN